MNASVFIVCILIMGGGDCQQNGRSNFIKNQQWRDVRRSRVEVMVMTCASSSLRRQKDPLAEQDDYC